MEEVKRVLGDSEEGKLAVVLIEAYRKGGHHGVKRALKDWLARFGVDVEVK